jgi:hypothetical protein
MTMPKARRTIDVAVRRGSYLPNLFRHERGVDRHGSQRKRKKNFALGAGGAPDFRRFRSPRITFANLTPRGFTDNRKLIMGHSGDITLVQYVWERFGATHIKRLVTEVRKQAVEDPRRGVQS